jgi:DNA repair exonuclease SbcCD ATPase subunit
MEKKNTPSQRSATAVDSSESTQTTETQPKKSGVSVGDAPGDALGGTRTTRPAIEEARQRIQTVNRTADSVERTVPPVPQDLFLDERNDVMEVINELEDQLDRHQEVRERLETELKEANENLQTTGQRAQELEWQVVTLQTRVEALEQVRQEVALLEDEVANANGHIQRLTDEQGRVEKERARLRAELKAANKQLEELWAVRKERDGLRSDVKTITAKAEELERGQRDLIDERNALNARIQEMTTALDEARSDRHQHQIMLRVADDRARELARVQDELTDKIESLRAEKKKLQSHIAHMERESARLIEQRQFYETELSSMRNANRSAETALSSVKKAFAEVRVALTETKMRSRRRMVETWPRIGVPLRGIDSLGSDTTETRAEALAGAGSGEQAAAEQAKG